MKRECERCHQVIFEPAQNQMLEFLREHLVEVLDANRHCGECLRKISIELGDEARGLKLEKPRKKRSSKQARDRSKQVYWIK